MVVHGTSDTTVAIINAEQVLTQYSTTLSLILGNGKTTSDLTDVPTTTQSGQAPVSGGRAYTLYDYDYATTGKTLLKYLKVTGMSHAWSGGSSSGKIFLFNFFFSQLIQKIINQFFKNRDLH